MGEQNPMVPFNVDAGEPFEISAELLERALDRIDELYGDDNIVNEGVTVSDNSSTIAIIGDSFPDRDVRVHHITRNIQSWSVFDPEQLRQNIESVRGEDSRENVPYIRFAYGVGFGCELPLNADFSVVDNIVSFNDEDNVCNLDILDGSYSDEEFDSRLAFVPEETELITEHLE